MNGIMLDTSAYSAFLGGKPEIKEVLQQADEICLSPIALGELLAGFKSGKREEWNRKILRDFVSSPRVRVIDLDGGTSERYAAIAAFLRERGTPISTNDIWIAALAMQHGLNVLTTDRHYLKVPQVVTDYYE